MRRNERKWECARASAGLITWKLRGPVSVSPLPLSVSWPHLRRPVPLCLSLLRPPPWLAFFPPLCLFLATGAAARHSRNKIGSLEIGSRDSRGVNEGERERTSRMGQLGPRDGGDGNRVVKKENNSSTSFASTGLLRSARSRDRFCSVMNRKRVFSAGNASPDAARSI